MKKLLLLVTLSASAFAQEPATTGAAAGAGATLTPPAAAVKKMPLSSTDKKFLKDSLDGAFFIMEVTGLAKNSAKLDGTKKLATDLKTQLDKVWAEVGEQANAHEENKKPEVSIPTELSGADKGKVERLKKSGDKFDKEMTKIVSKEVDKLAKSFEAVGKSGQDPKIKDLGKWGPTLADLAKQADTAEKEAAKAK